VGTASFLPPLLTIVISCMLLPNSLIGPEVEESVEDSSGSSGPTSKQNLAGGAGNPLGVSPG